MSGADERPLVLTAELDDESFTWLDDLRRRHFPPERNHLAAHLTLFHALPSHHEDRVLQALTKATNGRPPIDAVAAHWMLLGRGVAMAIEAPGLVALRAGLATALSDVLTRQDAGGFRAHVTVQNKVTPGEARALKEGLDAAFSPRRLCVPALRLWRYDGGPWEPLRRLPLCGAA